MNYIEKIRLDARGSAMLVESRRPNLYYFTYYFTIIRILEIGIAQVRRMEKRRLGRTGHMASIITFGSACLWNATQEEADRAVQLVLEHGVNVFDVAPSYGKAEELLGKWIPKIRSQIFLNEKTLERTREGAMKELRASLEKLGARYFDLYQLHAVSTMEELDTALGKGGAIEAFKEAQEVGLIRFIGITGHSDMRVLAEALRRFDFDTVMLPVNYVSMAFKAPENNFQQVLEIARDKGVGVFAIKAVAKRRWRTEERRYNTWYEPFDTQREIDMAVWFTLSQDGVVSYSSTGDLRLLPMILDAGERFRKISEEEQRELIEYARRRGFSPLFPEK